MKQQDTVLARVAALKAMPTPKLKEQWRALFDTPPPPYNRRFLESRLAYRIQELAYGGLKPETVRRLEQLGEQLALLLDGASARGRVLNTETFATAAAIAAVLIDNAIPS